MTLPGAASVSGISQEQELRQQRRKINCIMGEKLEAIYFDVVVFSNVRHASKVGYFVKIFS